MQINVDFGFSVFRAARNDVINNERDSSVSVHFSQDNRLGTSGILFDSAHNYDNVNVSF